MKKKAFLIRPWPHDEYRMKEFLKGNIIAVGWKATGDLNGVDKQEIKDILSKIQSESYKSISALSTLKIVALKMKKGDYVIVPDQEDIHIGIIEGEYQFSDKPNEENYPHQRPVKWLLNNLKRSELPESLKKTLRVPRTSAMLTPHVEIIEALVNHETVESDSLNLSFDELTLKAMNVLKNQLNNRDPMVQLEAAKIILSIQ
jgi:restriction system protein